MKKSRKIGLIVIIPVAILGAMFLSLDLFENSTPLQSENRLDEVSSDMEDILSLDLPVVGFSDAPVIIIAFNDYQCQGCKTWYEKEFPKISKSLIETQKANIVFLDSISLGNDSVLASEATFCANEQEKYSEYQEMLFKSQQKIDDWAKSAQLKKFAMGLELNSELFQECLDSRKYENKVLSNIEYAKNFGIDKIPVFKIVNFEGKEHILKGGLPSSSFEEVVNRFQ